jgi:hypothetical protein
MRMAGSSSPPLSAEDDKSLDAALGDLHGLLLGIQLS